MCAQKLSHSVVRRCQHSRGCRQIILPSQISHLLQMVRLRMQEYIIPTKHIRSALFRLQCSFITYRKEVCNIYGNKKEEKITRNPF